MRQEQTYVEHLLLLNVSELQINWWMMLYVSERESAEYYAISKKQTQRKWVEWMVCREAGEESLMKYTPGVSRLISGGGNKIRTRF